MLPLVTASTWGLIALISARLLIAAHDHLPPQALSWAFSVTSLLLVAALVGLARTAGDDRPAAALAAFCCAVAVWAWQEVAAAPLARRSRRIAGHATATSLWHELTWLPVAAGVLALTWGGVNEAGRWAFLALWATHLCARLNAWAGDHVGSGGPLVRPPWFAPELPAAQLLSALFPLSVTGMTAAATLVLERAWASAGADGAVTGLALAGMALALGTLGQWGLVLKVRWPRRLTPSREVWRGAAPPEEPKELYSGA